MQVSQGPQTRSALEERLLEPPGPEAVRAERARAAGQLLQTEHHQVRSGVSRWGRWPGGLELSAAAPFQSPGTRRGVGVGLDGVKTEVRNRQLGDQSTGWVGGRSLAWNWPNHW